MRAFFPQPLMSVVLLALWLVLNGFSLGQGLLGLLLAWAIPMALPRPALPAPRLAAPWVTAKLVLVVLHDIVKANIDVALRILGPESRIHSTYVWVPVDIQSAQGLVVFAGIITMTPGTLSCEISPDRRWLLVHCFHAEDTAAVVDEVKTRYEKPLMEIFR